jgi:two-component system, NtrC family, nitrogen regulation response regulator GlnG
MLRLVVATGPDRGASLLLRRGTYSVGKAPDCDLVLRDPAVSRRHLILRLVPFGIEVTDTDSKNGSFFQGARFRQLVIGAGAAVVIGDSQLVFAESQRHSTEPAVSPEHHFGGLVGHSLVMRRLFALLDQVAAAPGPVLIEGETGTGKELCAESIHAAGPRAGAPLVVCDLAAVPPALLESELFGHVRGAFSGADRDHVGAFAMAAGGTLFLDEVAELGPDSQPRLLRALERREVKPLGASRYQAVDVRVIAASNRDLWQECRAGRFRADLYHRLAVLRVRLPPLRERREDIPLLARSILARRARELTPDALSLLAAHKWPGNVRELRNVLTHATSFVPAGAIIGPAQLGMGSAERPAIDLASAQDWADGSDFHHAKKQIVASWEKSFLADLMQRAEGNVARAAKKAGLDRPYLYRLLRKHGLGPAEEAT